MARPKFLIPITTVTFLLVAAGCTGGPPPATPTGPDSPSATERPVGTGDLPYDLRIRNYENATRTVTVTVTFDGTGERIFSESARLGPGERIDRDLPFHDPGNYTVEATVDGTTYEYVWHLEVTPPSHELIVTADRGEVYFTRSAA